MSELEKVLLKHEGTLKKKNEEF